MRPLVWFRGDLRTKDNPALHHAAAEAQDGVVAVFVFCPRQWKRHDWGVSKIRFVAQNVVALSQALERLRIPLLLQEVPDFEDVPPHLLRLAKRHRCDGLFFNQEHEVNERRRDKAVETRFAAAGIDVRSFFDQTLIEPGRLLTATGGFYSVFTPFRNAFIRRLHEDGIPKPLSPPRRQSTMPCAPDPLPAGMRRFDHPASPNGLWPAGEKRARRRLSAFIEKRIDGYHRDRDAPDRDGTSQLSPYLAAGVLSAREALWAAVAANKGKIADGRKGIATWISQLIWREFYRHVLVGFPRVSMNRPFKPETDGVTWRYDERNLKAWSEGRTGYPIVDAGMRQLRETGWMHNRLRMITAMFLSKHLLLDWRLGERHFMRFLVDADLANNNGGWQWSASTGTDAVPYFRVFNPWNQSRRFDPGGTFIRRFVPELKQVPDAALHNPARLADITSAKRHYPSPIVDHRRARERAIEAFRKARGRSER